MSFTMRKPCNRCFQSEGRIETKNGQDCVRCSECGDFQYNAPKTETGRKPRTVTTVHNGIKANQRVRILMRATGRCELCGGKDDLHVGHLISVDTGLKLGMTEVQLNDDDNLCCLCAECNLGMSSEPVPARILVAMAMARLGEKLDGSKAS